MVLIGFGLMFTIDDVRAIQPDSTLDPNTNYASLTDSSLQGRTRLIAHLGDMLSPGLITFDMAVSTKASLANHSCPQVTAIVFLPDHLTNPLDICLVPMVTKGLPSFHSDLDAEPVLVTLTRQSRQILSSETF